MALVGCGPPALSVRRSCRRSEFRSRRRAAAPQALPIAVAARLPASLVAAAALATGQLTQVLDVVRGRWLVQCPAGAGPGSTIQVQHGGTILSVPVPAGIQSGMAFSVEAPAAAQPVVSAPGDEP